MDYKLLQDKALQIRSESLAGANTADKVGSVLVEVVNLVGHILQAATKTSDGYMPMEMVGELKDATATIAALHSSLQSLSNSMEAKVDKVSGMGLSHNDFTTAEKNKLAQAIGDLQTLQTALGDKVDKVGGMGLSRHDYSDIDHDAVQQFIAMMDDLKEMITVNFYDFVNGVAVAPGGTDVTGKLVYDTATNKILWKVMYPGNPTPTYFDQVFQKPIVGTSPIPGVTYRFGDRIFLGIKGGLSEQFRTVIETIE